MKPRRLQSETSTSMFTGLPRRSSRSSAFSRKALDLAHEARRSHRLADEQGDLAVEELTATRRGGAPASRAFSARSKRPYTATLGSRSAVRRPTHSAIHAAWPSRSRSSRTRANGRSTSKWSTRTSSLRPVSKKMSSPSVSSSSAPLNFDLIRRAARATPRILPCCREKNVTTRSLSPSAKLPITTAVDLPSAISGGQAEAEFTEGPLVLAPRTPHLHGEPQEHLNTEEGLQLAPGVRPDPLEHGAAAADQDALLGVPLDEDRRPDVEAFGPGPLRETLDAHRDRVRHFLVRQVEDLLAHDLGHVERLRLIAGGVGREVGRMLGQRGHDQIEETVTVGAIAARDRQDLAEGMDRSPTIDQRQEPGLRRDGVRLAEQTEHGGRVHSQRLDEPRIGIRPLGGVDDRTHEVDVLQRALGRSRHELAELAGDRPQAGRIHEDDLRRRQIADPRDPVTRRLRPRRHDGELLADEPVQQRRLARVRPSDQRHEAGTRGPGGRTAATHARSPFQSAAGARVPSTSRSRSCMRRASTGSRSSYPTRWSTPCVTSSSSSATRGTPTRCACRAAVSMEITT